MPLYEYQCRRCGQQFEALVRIPNTPACPSCHCADLEQMISAFAVSTEERTQSALRVAQREFEKGRRDKLIAEQEEKSHHHDH